MMVITHKVCSGPALETNSKDAKKQTKKKPAMTMKEKKAAKRAAKETFIR